MVNGTAPPGGVYISQCLHRQVNAFNAVSLLRLFQDSRGRRIGWGPEFDAMISRSRSIQMTLFLMSPQFGDVMIFIDDDIGYEPEGFHQLVETCENTRGIACGLYVARETQWPHPTLAAYPGTSIVLGPEQPPVEVKWGATGFMAIHRDVVEALAEQMELCQSGPREFYPFFMPFVYEGEFLSEDYAFSQKAREAGFKVWCDPRIRLSHEGRRAYTISDLEVDLFSQLSTLTIDEGGPDITGLMPDLSRFTGLKPNQLQSLMSDTPMRVPAADEWYSANPETPAEVVAFYQNSDSYLLELVHFNLRADYNRRCTPATTLRGKVIDFGGGIGTLSLRLLKMGLQVTYVDVPSKHREFAEFRFRQKEAQIPCHDSLSELPEGAYDGIAAIDVLEHIHPSEISELAREFFRVLKPGGKLVSVSDFHTDETIPEHYETDEEWDVAISDAGFVADGGDWRRPMGSKLSAATAPAAR